MYCSKCGNEIEEKSGVCEKCGIKIGNERTADKKKTNKKKAVYALIAVGILVIIGVVILIVSKGKYENKPILKRQEIERSSSENDITEYDRKGNMIYHQFVNGGKVNNITYTYEFDDKERPIKMYGYGSNGELEELYAFEYQENEEMTRISSYNIEDGKVLTEVSEKDKDGNPLKISTYRSDGELFATIEYSYGEKEKSVLRCTYYEGEISTTSRTDYISVKGKWLISQSASWDTVNGMSSCVYVYEYDTFGNAISALIYDEEGDAVGALELENNLVVTVLGVCRQEYEYDEDGNCIVYKVYQDDEIIFTYNYEYYE